MGIGECRKATCRYISDTGGFTILEAVVAMGVLGVMMGLILGTFYIQSRSNTTQSQVVTMHQGARAGLDIMTRAIRMAGIDPSGTRSFGFFHGDSGVSTQAQTNATSISFRFDDNEDGIVDDSESTSFRMIGNQVRQLVYDDSSGAYVWELLLEDVEALDFVYLDESGGVISTPSSALDSIRAVQVTLVARTSGVAWGKTDTSSYSNKQGTLLLAAQNDNASRLRLSTTVRCRNMDLN